MKTIEYILTKIGNLYYVLDEEEPKPRQWTIQNKPIIACSSLLESCLQIDKEQIEELLYENATEHTNSLIDEHQKPIDHKLEFVDRIIELEAEEAVNNGLTLKITNGKVIISSIK